MRVRTLREASFRRPWRVILPTTLLFLGAVSVATLLPPRYRAGALIRAEWEEDEAAVRGVGADLASRRLQSLRQRLLSCSAALRALDERGPTPLGNGVSAPPSEPRGALAPTVSLVPRGADVFVIECVHSDPGKAALIANRLASSLVADTENERAKREGTNPLLVEARFNRSRKEVAEKEAAIRLLRERRDGSMPEAGDTDPGKPGRLEAEKRALVAVLSAARTRCDRLLRAIEDGERAPVAKAGESAELARLRAEQADLRKKYTDEHPDVEALARRIQRLEAAIPSTPSPQLGGQVDALRNQLAQAEAEVADLSGKEERLDAEIVLLGRPVRATENGSGVSEPDIDAMTRDLEQARTTYLSLQEEWQAAETAWRLSRGVVPKLRVVEEAHVPTRPFFPNRLLFGLVGLALGLALGLSAAQVAERRDPSVKGPEDLQELLKQPLLAEIPFVRVPRSSRRG